ncbi:MAG: ribonuclease III [Clostridia bacterium]|nr:ribonuclease III [Clostridia bacterium]
MSPDISLNFDKLKTENTSSDGYPVSALAFLGDGVWGIMVREYLTVSVKCKAGKLHEKNIEMVNATFQANAIKMLMPYLSEEETTIFIRGRNTHTTHTPRNKSKSDYHAATGLEVLFGWLYINGNTDRLKELFGFVTEVHNG